MGTSADGLQRRVLHLTANPSVAYRALTYLGAAIFTFVSLFPLYLTLVLSVTPTAVTREMPVVPRTLSTSGFSTALFVADWFQAITNSVIIATVSTGIVLSLGILAGYVLGRIEFVGRRPIGLTVVGLAFFPPQAVAPPIIELALTPPVVPGITIPDLYGTKAGIILPTSSMLLPMAVILFALYFKQIPDDLEAAARVEGATRLGALYHVVLPLSKPAIAAVGCIVFIQVYNDYFWSAVLTGGTESVPTISNQLNGLMAHPNMMNADYMAAASLIGLVPPLVVILFITGRFDAWMRLWT